MQHQIHCLIKKHTQCHLLAPGLLLKDEDRFRRKRRILLRGFFDFVGFNNFTVSAGEDACVLKNNMTRLRVRFPSPLAHALLRGFLRAADRSRLDSLGRKRHIIRSQAEP